jgi:hypothetical protein
LRFSINLEIFAATTMKRVFPFLPCSLLVLTAACSLHAQVPGLGTPAFRLTPAQVAQAAQRIDAAVIAQERERWEKEMRSTDPERRVPFALPPQADDVTFLRRVTLDLQARNPESNVIRVFLVDADPAKRAKAVDRLLLEPASGARRFTRFADMLRVKDNVLGVSLRPFIGWLQDACANSMPYDRFVREIITASGEVDTNPATGWLLADAGRGTTTMMEALRIFLDEDLHCAQCHDHPFSDWTQMQYYQFAACLGGAQVLRSGPQGMTKLWPADLSAAPPESPLVPGERLMIADFREAFSFVLPQRYKYKDGDPGDIVSPATRDWKGDAIAGAKSMRKFRGEKLRGEFANWLTSNQRFAEVAAMRTWISLFGWTGNAWNTSLDFTDDQRVVDHRSGDRSCSNAGPRNLPMSLTAEFLEDNRGPANQMFLRTLGRELVLAKYDLREFERILCNTAAYQRESRTVPLGMPARPGAPILRRLPPETVWNNLVLIQSDGAIPAAAPLSHELVQVPDSEHPLRVLGRGTRTWGDDSLPHITHRIVRLMMNGDPARLASDADGPLVRRLRHAPAPAIGIDEAFLAVLARFPSDQERLKAMDHGIAHPDTLWSDLLWSLLNTSEFLFQR